MTREEASKMLKSKMDGHTDTSYEWVETVRMAIKALEQEPCEDCRNCKKWDDCECGRKGHINGTSIGYSIGECKDYEPSGDAVTQAFKRGYDHAMSLKSHEIPQESSGDAVSRQVVKEQMIKYGFHAPDMTVTEFVEDLLPPVKQERTGHWRPVYQGDEIINYRCSECDFGNTFGKSTYRMHYCPNCGARMESEDK